MSSGMRQSGIIIMIICFNESYATSVMALGNIAASLNMPYFNSSHSPAQEVSAQDLVTSAESLKNISHSNSSVLEPQETSLQKHCGPLNQLLSEEQLCEINGEAEDCPPFSKENTIMIKKCKPFYTKDNVKSTNYLCQNGEWIQDGEPCKTECGLVDSTTNDTSRYPWLTSVYHYYARACIGILISPYHILTSAMEVTDDQFNPKPPEQYTVLQGIHEGDLEEILALPLQFKKVTKTIIHPNYRGQHDDNLAILLVLQPFELSPSMMPICIDWSSMYDESDFQVGNQGKDVGYVIIPGTPLDILTEFDIEYREKSDCDAKFKNNSHTLMENFGIDKFCARLLTNDSYVCNQGGKVLFFKSDPLRYYLKGLQYVASGCSKNINSNPYVYYTKVSNYLPWLWFHVYLHTTEPGNNQAKHMKTANNVTRGCSLPGHITNGIFSMKDGSSYVAKAVAPLGTIISLSCDDSDTENSLRLFLCTQYEWYPSLRNIKCNSEVTKVTTGCLLPKHLKYGNFSTTDGSTYSPDRLIAHSATIILICAEATKGNSPTIFFCLQDDWYPLIKRAKCKKPGVCSSLKTSPSEDVICQLNGSRTSCTRPENNTEAVVQCKPFYKVKERQPIYKCINGSWDQNFISCSPECGKKRVDTTTLIIGGNDTVKNEYPWVVAIYNSNNQHICGGTIISRYYVLSAAHCFTNSVGQPKNKEDYTMIAGKYYRDINVQELNSQKRKIKTLFIHDDYRGRLQRFRDDIALVELDEMLTVSFEVQPVCMDWQSVYEDFDFIDENEAVIVGWGYTRESHTPSNVPKKLIVPYRSKSVCIRHLPLDYAQEFLASDKICAGYINNKTNICQGDSGGGLYFRSDGEKYYIRGIASITVKSKIGCDANQYALYTKVSKYLRWIESKTRRIV